MNKYVTIEESPESVMKLDGVTRIAEITRSYRMKDLSALLNSITQIQKQLVQIRLANKYSDQDFSSLIEYLPGNKDRQHAQHTFEVLFTEIESVLPDFRAQRVFVQDEAVFYADTSKPWISRITRTSKFVFRRLQRFPYVVFNRIGEIRGKDSIPFPEWHHRNFPGRLARHELYLQRNEIESWIHSDLLLFRELALLIGNIIRRLHESISRSEDDPAEETTEKGIREIVQTGIDDIKYLRNLVRKAIQNSESDSRLFSENLYSSILGKSKRAGTLEFPNLLYTEKKLRKKRAAAIARLSEQSEIWYHDYGAQTDRVLAGKSLFSISFHLNMASRQLISGIESLFKDILKKHVIEANREFDNIHSEFDQKKISGRKSDVQKAIRTLKKDLKVNVIDLLNSHLSGYDSSIPLFEDAENFINDVLSATAKIPGEVRLIESSDPDSIPPATQTEEIHLRRAIDTYIRSDIIRDIKPLTSRIESFISGTNRELAELTNITDVNLSMATDVLEDSGEAAEALNLVAESLDRIGKRLESTLRKMDTECNFCVEIVQKHTQDAVDYLCGLVINQELIRLKWKTRELEVRSAARGWKDQLAVMVSSSYDTTAVWVRFAGRKSGTAWSDIRRFLGYRVETVGTIKTDVSNYLAETGRRLAELPLIYRRLFSFEPLEERRFLSGRQTAIKRFEQVYMNWRRGLFANVMFAGERGSGKTTIINIISEIPDKDIPLVKVLMEHTIYDSKVLIDKLCEALSIGKVSDVDSFIESVQKMENRTIVILEGFQNLYIRNINGFSAIECFLLILSRTSQKIFWIVTSSRYAWNYLNKVIRTAEYFTEIIYCDELKQNEIYDLIMHRHSMSGYELYFERNQRIENTRAFKKLKGNSEAEQEYLGELYFENLTEIAEGNATIAIIYWLRSVAETNSSRITIMPLDEKRVQLSADLSEDALFALMAILLHDDLTDCQLAGVLNISEEKSRLLLSRMTSRSIFYEKEGRYYLNNMLYRHATRIVAGKNILH
jgi:ABC-type branched-subunit amino acid transport system ATPase component